MGGLQRICAAIAVDVATEHAHAHCGGAQTEAGWQGAQPARSTDLGPPGAWYL
jgi:hypothetical protein